jgi:hypothetical protein
MEYTIIKTNFSEVTFLNGNVKEVYAFSSVDAVSFDAAPKGPFRFEILNEPVRNPVVLNKLFREPYFSVEENDVQLTETGIEVMMKALHKRNANIEEALALKDDHATLVIKRDNEGHVQTHNSMPSVILARTIIMMTRKDPNFDKALKAELLKDAVEHLTMLTGIKDG